jgi:hypothetical protein
VLDVRDAQRAVEAAVGEQARERREGHAALLRRDEHHAGVRARQRVAVPAGSECEVQGGEGSRGWPQDSTLVGWGRGTLFEVEPGSLRSSAELALDTYVWAVLAL